LAFCSRTAENKKKEKIKQILKNNEYHIHTTNTKPTTKLNRNEPHNPPQKKWITITYFRPHTRMITKLFRTTGLRMALRTENTTNNT
jgi:hypothetical protein